MGVSFVNIYSAISFAKSSKKYHEWFIHTTIYKENLETYTQKKGMTWKVKFRIILIGFVMMNRMIMGWLVLNMVWIFHVLYFLFGIKTLTYDEE